MTETNYDLIQFAADITGSECALTVRVTKEREGGARRISARDLIGVVCQKNIDDAGKIWRRLNPTIMAELTPHLCEFKFDSGRGSRMQPVLTLQGCFKLLMMLPGQQAKLFRSQVATVLLGFFAGDEQLVAEVRANAENKGLLNEVAREELQEVRATAEGGASSTTWQAKPLDELKQRELAVTVGKQELALQRAQLRMRLEEKAKLTDAEVAHQLKIADAEQAHKEKVTAAEVAAQTKLAAVQRDNEDRASAAKRRRLDEEAMAERHRVDAEIALVQAKGEAQAAVLRAKAQAELEARRANVAGAVAELTAVLRDAGQSAETIAAAVSALLARLDSTQRRSRP